MEAVSRSTIMDVMDSIGQDYDSIREDYTGRASLSGAPCFGITFESPSWSYHFFAVLGEMNGDMAADLARNAHTDAMGQLTIVYFPLYTLDGA